MLRPPAAAWLCVAVWLPTAVWPQTQAPPQRRNWFNDPFFTVSSQVAHCPVPAGPFMTEAERRVQSHGRAERGTTCWLAGQCERPNSYAYDTDIAQAVQSAFTAHHPAPRSSLWVTVQRRVVYLEGCVSDAHDEKRLHDFVMANTPHVERVIAIVYVKQARARPPYKLLSAPSTY
ncbi:BON domain-containing protein [Sphaerotilaceae bacterium SBD11-9]